MRDLLIAGLGDSIAAGEGNPDRPVALADDGFCFRQFIGTPRSEYFRPGRAGFKGDRACDQARDSAEAADAWNKLAARWQNAACHRSLYSYQLRAALALAVEHPHHRRHVRAAGLHRRDHRRRAFSVRSARANSIAATANVPGTRARADSRSSRPC